MSFFDDASWVLIPEGIKEDVVYAQKPTDGLGDLTFTRASDATRTNSAGVVERTPWNLLTFSEMFSDVAWVKSNSSISANTSIAPNGTLTADTIASTTIGSEARARQTITQTSGTTYTLSCYAKKGSVNWFIVRDLAVNSTAGRAWFNLNNGTIGTVNSGLTASIQNVGDGWYRCSITGVSNGVSNLVDLAPALSDGAINATSIGESVYIWGAQLVEGTDAKPYFATTNRQDVPRLDYRNADGTLNSCPRLLLEPQRTNSIRNSSMVGAVAGTPGTLPTNYAQLGGAGLTRTISIGTENGLPYIDLRFVGTATDSLVRILLENSTQIAAATGQTWTISSYIKNVLISNPADSFTYAMYERTSGGSAVASGFQTITPTSSLQRIAYTRTLNGGATVAFVSIEIQGGLTIGQSYDFTIRIAAPQMELGAYATTWVPTTTAAVTRLADGASKTGVSSLIGQTEGTLFFEFQFQPTSLNQSFAISDGTSANRLDIRLGSNIPAVSIITGGVIQAFIGSAVTMTQGQRVKVACGYKNNDVALYQNGALVGSTSSATIGGTLSRLGFDLNGGQFMNSPISQAAIFPTRLTNDQLAQLTTL